MKFYKIFIFFLYLVFYVNFSFGQAFDWSYKIGGSSNDMGRRIISDSANNFYVLGFYSGTVVLDSAGTPINMTGFGGTDIFLIKYNCNKIFQWKVKVGGSGNESANFNQCGIELGSNGDIYVIDQFEGTANFVSSNGSVQTKSSQGSWDVFTMKLSNSGIIQWVVTASSNGWEESGEVAVDKDGNVCVTGFFSNTCTFNSSSGPSQTLSSAGSTDAFVAKYNSLGVLQFAIRAGSTSQEAPSDIQVDSNGNIYTCGNFACCSANSATFGSTVLNNQGSWGGYIAKVSPTGNWLWANGMGGTGSESFQKIIFNNSQTHMFAFGHAQGTSTISSQAPGSSITVTSFGGHDAVVVGLDLNGSMQWAKHLGGSGDDYSGGVSIGTDGNPIFVGSYQGNANFDGITSTSPGTSSLFVSKFTSNGNIIYLKKAGASGSVVYGNDVHTSPSGVTYVTGSFTNTVNFLFNSLTSSGSSDGFIAKFSDVDTTIIVAEKLNINCNDSTKLSVVKKSANQFQWYRNDTIVVGAINNYYYAKSSGIYKLVVFNNCVNPDTSNTITITSSGLSLIKSANPTICSGDSVGLIVSGGNSYLWSPGKTLSDSTISNPYAKPITTTKYYLQAFKNSCSQRDSITVTVINIVVSAGLDKFICLGDSVQLDGVTSSSFTWQPTTTMTDSTQIKPYVKPSINIKYILKATSGSCVQRDTVEVFVTQVSSNAGLDKNICLGDSVQLNGTAIGAFKWKPTTYMSDSNLINPYVKPPSSISYILTAAQGACSRVDTVKVNVSNASAYAGLDKNICFGDSVRLDGVATGSFTWQPTTAMNDSTQIKPYVKPSINIKYILKATSGSCVQRDTVEVFVTQVSSNAGLDKNICLGDSVQLNGTAIGAFKWKPTTYMSDSNLINPYVKPPSSISYFLTAAQGACSRVDTVKVNVSNASAYAGLDKNICFGDSVRLDGVATGSFTWQPTTAMNDSTQIKPYVKPTGNTKYILQASLGSCIQRDTVDVFVTQVSSNAGLDKNICLGDSVQLNGSAIGAFKWKPTTYMSDSNLVSPYVKPASSISYILTVTQGTCSRADTVKVNVSNASAYAGLDKHICLGDSIQLDGVATGSFTWQPTTAMKDTTQIKPFVKPISDTKYILKASFGSCVQRDTVDVIVNQVLANAGKNLTVCLGDSVQLQGTALGNVTWQPSTFLNNPSLTQPYSKPTTNIDYILTATNGTCVQKDTVSVSLFTNASANAGADQRICLGSGVFLNAATANTYEWTPPYFITNSNSQNPFVNPLVDTTYYLKISMGSCFGFDTVKVKVVPIPSVKASDDTKVCLGDSVQLNAQVSSPAKWVWRSQVQLSDSNILNPKAKITQSSIFIIIASDTSKLCYASDTMIVDPYPVVKAIYSADNYSGEGQLKPVFDNTSQNATKYTWLFGDSLNSNSKDKNPDFTFIRPGVYKVKLIAQNDYGCKDSITKEFTVLPAGKLYIPNAFTPNGDMFNEVFKFTYPESAYKKVEMTIYNRWGGFIYETSMPGGKWWDGTFEGAPCSEDVYFYMAKAIKINDEVNDYHGTITLVR
jgi:gliding motility-associated-like protein